MQLVLHTTQNNSLSHSLVGREDALLFTALSFKLLSVLSEFLESVAAIYQDLLAGKNPNTVIVPTSSSGQHRQRQPSNDCNPHEGVEASLFYQCLESLCDRSKYRYEWNLKYKFEVSVSGDRGWSCEEREDFEQDDISHMAPTEEVQRETS